MSSRSKTKAELEAELKKLRAAYLRKKASKAYKPKKSYSKRSSGYGASIGSALGSMIAGAPGKALGSMIGKKAGSLFQKITGHGDYKVSSNSIISGIDPPMFAKNGRGTIVRHREFITDISGSTAFSSRVFPIQPGLNSSYPWLAQVAANYEEYIIRGMVYEFKSTSANALNSTNTALGTVIMATRYNVLLPAFASKTEMENYEFVSTTKPSESCMHPVECAVGESPLHVLYTRVSATTVGDLRMYDLGNFQISTVGMQAAATIGELWVTYDVELLKPRISSISSGYEADHFRLYPTGYASGAAHGSSPVTSSDSNFGCTITSNSIIVPDYASNYYFMILYQVTGVSTTHTVGITATYGSSLTTLYRWTDNTAPWVANNNGSVSSNNWYMALIQFTASSGSTIQSNRTITWAAHTAIASMQAGDLWIMGVNTPVATLIEEKKAIEGVSSESKEEKKTVAPVTADEESEDDEYEEFLRMKRAKAIIAAHTPMEEHATPRKVPSVKS